MGFPSNRTALQWRNRAQGASWDAPGVVSVTDHHWVRSVCSAVWVSCMPDSFARYRIFLSYMIEIGTHHLNNSASWRIPVGLQMLWGLILLSGIFFLPESP